MKFMLFNPTIILLGYCSDFSFFSDEDKKAYGVKNGVKIIGVPEQYNSYGLLNKVMIEVDDNDIEDIEDAKNLFEKISRYGRTSITLVDENQEKE